MSSAEPRQRILVYLPDSRQFHRAARKARRADATAVWQLDADGESLPRLDVGDRDLIRIGIDTDIPGELAGGGVVLGADHALDVERFRARVETLRNAGVTVYAEVTDVDTARNCEDWGADALIACGFEAGGFIGEESGLVLLRRLYNETSLPVIVRGGIGPDSAAAVIAAGASGYALEQQLWLTSSYPVEGKVAKRLETFNPTDTQSLGVTLDFRYRVFSMIATRTPDELAEREVELVDDGGTAGDLYAEIRAAEPAQSWNFDLRNDLWALGQGAALASTIRDRYQTADAAISGIRDHVTDVLRGLRDDFPLEVGKGIADVNGTELPIHQGPMAQVADVPEFAKAVSDSGSLPWLALANMPTQIAEDIVDDTSEILGDRPYGAGIIGLDANRYRDGHMEMMKQKRQEAPLLGLVAAGTAEQAMQFESADIRTYLHTPTPGVLRAALRSGHTKFLLEGAEAGGHVGTLGGLALWQYGVLKVEEAIDDGAEPEELAVVPAGGISDAPSAAATAALFFGLHRRGVNFGIQMGTAYLMTKEAVETGALSETYQDVAEDSDGTVIMGETVNTPTRVLSNSAADRVLEREKDRLTEGVDLNDRKHLYEKDNLGGLRAAAKGERIASVDPEKGATFETISRDDQLDQGLFHCGQGVALCDRRFTMEELHREVTEGARRWIEDDAWRASFRPKSQRDQQSTNSEHTMTSNTSSSGATEIIDGDRAIAIVGIGAKMPGALDKDTFWDNIVGGKSAIGPVPDDRWDPELYYDPDQSAPDKTYSKIGGWVRDFEFDRRAFRLPPKVVESIDPTQLMSLEATKEALEDGGYLDADFDRDRCAVIMGNALGGDLRDTTNQRILYPEVDRVLKKSLMELGSDTLNRRQRQELLEQVEERFKSEIVGVNEDSMPGELANIVAGRVAQTFDLRGPNFITDAACASSLAAIEAAVRGLRTGHFDMAVTGGSDRTMGAPSFVKFSKIGALSPDGSRPFDADANGFVMGEGAGVMLLKRLSDAVEDDDKIYAVIRGVGGSSDGRGKAITAPNPKGQALSIKRAYEDAGYGPRTVSMIEAHGTSTPVGDPAEVETIKSVMDDDSSELSADRIALGSVKSNIGHLKSAAGAAGVIKAAMALKHGVLPPTLNVETPNPKLDIDDSPLTVQTDAEEWTVHDGAPRRAGVSAFGFGGTNFHVALEEYGANQSGSGKTTSFPSFSASTTGGGGGGAFVADVPKGEGILTFSARSEDELSDEFDAFVDAYERGGESAIAEWKIDFNESTEAGSAGPVRLALAYADGDELEGKISRTQRALDGRMSWRVLANQGVIFSDDTVDGKTAMLFPGQGSQYLGMLSDLRERFSVVDETFREADEIMKPVIGTRLSDIIDPDLDEVDQAQAFRALTKTENTQPAVLTADIALYRLLGELGIEPAMVAGHSLGEYGACVAAGVLSFEEALKTVAARGTEMSNATPMNGDEGLMAGISAPVDVVRPVLDDIDGYVVCANINCPSQTIIAGLTDAVEEAKERFEEMDYKVPLLPVSHAFHSKVVAAASEPLRSHLEDMDVQSPQIPILTNVTGDFYPTGSGAPDEIRDLLSEQVASPVQYIDLIETMYDQGARAFVEVGPKRAQTSFVNSILEDRDRLALYTNHPKKGGVTTLYEALATLWARGVWQQETTEKTDEAQRGKVEANTGGAVPPRDEIVDVMMDVLCEKTGYDPAEIELGFELEADLGVDTVKQAEIMAEVREEFDLERDEDFRLADYPTLARMADYVQETIGAGATSEEEPAQQAESTETTSEVAASSGPAREEIVDVMMDVLCEKTGYDPAEIELGFELEADLGVDTVKQAEIMAEVREEFDLERDEDFRLADYPTLARMADYVQETIGAGATSEEEPAQQAQSTETTSDVAAASGPAREEIVDVMMDVLCEKTGYDPAEIELDFELEADLGVDTVKQAEIMAEVREEFELERDEDFRLADYPTLARMADYVQETIGAGAGGTTSEEEPAQQAQSTETTSDVAASSGPARDEIVDVMMDVLCEKTGYDPAEIELDFELEADLGVDTVKQAEIMAEVREEFDLERDEDFRLADYPTLARMADYVQETIGAGATTATIQEEPAQQVQSTETTSDVAAASGPAREEIVDVMMDVLCEKTGYDPAEIELDFELEADLGVDTVKQAEIMAEVREEFELERDEDFRLADYPTLARMADYVQETIGTGTSAQSAQTAETATEHHDSAATYTNGAAGPAVVDDNVRRASRTSPSKFADSDEPTADTEPVDRDSITSHDIDADVVISGCAAGLPGTEELFEEATIERLLEGTNFIEELTEELRESMVEKRITRLQKHEDGGGELVEVTETEEVIKLAGQGGDFDLSEWGIADRLIEALDKTSRLAFAAGFEALRDAGLPLIPRYRETTTGKKVTTGWTLPESVGDETGVIFASAFAGQDAMIEELNAAHEQGEEYQFNHRFLLRVLGIANSRFAEYVGARGPNTKINNACASTTTAIGMAQDWIRSGRCERVIILSADNASGDELMEWVGSGFLATGAATTKEDVTEAALPFDKRRHGMIVGMGALSLIVEEHGLAEHRGIEPIADVLETQFVNSAFHPTRLDVDHISGEVKGLIDRAEEDFQLDRGDIADRTVFISHETYTPARGGSAAAEISALRTAFGDNANEVVIANTKGFTGHAMGAGIEDVLAMKVLQHEQVPPIANFEQPDPDLGDLRLSDGGDYDADYALRLAAGFGSQLALALFRFRARGEDRLFDAAAYGDWLADVSDFEYPELSVEDRTLRLRRGEPTDRPPGGGIEFERHQPPSNPFEYQPVNVRVQSATNADVTGLQERLDGRDVAIVTDDPDAEMDDLLRRTADRFGARVMVVDTGDDLLDEDAVTRQFNRFGDVSGIINLLGIASHDADADTAYRASRNTFHVARAFADHRAREPGDDAFFLTVTDQGGTLGFGDDANPHPVAGAVGGFTKALSHEWDDAHIRVVDTVDRGLRPALGVEIFTELFSEGDVPEVGIVNGLRYEPVFYDLTDVTADTDGDNVAPDADSTIAVTGGAKGIGAEICVDLAERYGCNLALVGRSELTHADPLSVDMDAEKQRVRQRLEDAGERVTPVKVRDEMWPLKSQRTIATNLERMRDAGADVEYFSCDVSDGDGVRRLLDDIQQRFGNVTGVIHGAGAEESKFLVDKDLAGFDKVYRGKALGGLHLWSEVESMDPDFFVIFSSVAGRFGNEGQTDYSAANETLSKLVARINATTDVRGLSIDWTAWGEVGMATEGSMETILEARGVEFLPPEIGAPMVGQALEDGLTGEAIVAGELGEMGGDLVVDAPDVAPVSTTHHRDLALVGDVVDRSDDEIVVERIFDPEHDDFINDHVYEGTAILPGVMGYELMANAAQLLTGQPVDEVLKADFDRALKIHRGDPIRVTATGRIVDVDDKNSTVEVVVQSHRTSKTGRELEKEHFRADVICGTSASEAPKGFAIDGADDWKKGPKRDEIYRRFFHTGSFQVLDEVPLLSDDFVVGYGRVPGVQLVDGHRSGGFISDPLVREMALQTAGLWGMVENDLSYLPYAVERSVQYRRTEPGEEVCIRCRRRDDASEHAIAFDVEIRDADGELLHWLEKVELIGHQKLRDENRFDEFESLHSLRKPLGASEARACVAGRNIDALAMLSDEERQAYDRLRSPERRGEWLAARVAARLVISRYFRDFFGKSVGLDDIHVTKSDAGKPSAVVETNDFEISILPLPDLALTHSSGLAVAAVTVPECDERLGVDLERIEERTDNFAKSYFTNSERQLALPDSDGRQATLHTLLWTVKEAVSKALGVGLELSTHEIVVTDVRQAGPQWQVDVELRGQAIETLEGIGGGELVVDVEVASGFVLATARLVGSRALTNDWKQVRPSAKDSESSVNGVNGRSNGRNGAAHRTNGAVNGTTNGHRPLNGHSTSNEQAPTAATRAEAARAAIAELLGHRGRRVVDDDETRSWTF